MSRSLLVSFSCLSILAACGGDQKAGAPQGPAATSGLETAQLIVEADTLDDVYAYLSTLKRAN